MFYADDAVFVGEWSENNIATLVHVLDCFHKVSGLKINMNKSKIMGTHVDHDKVSRATNKLGCQILKAPFLYLGSYVGGNMNRLKSWDDIINRVFYRTLESIRLIFQWVIFLMKSFAYQTGVMGFNCLSGILNGGEGRKTQDEDSLLTPMQGPVDMDVDTLHVTSRWHLCLSIEYVRVEGYDEFLTYEVQYFETCSPGQQLVAATGGAANTCIDKERQALLSFKAQLQDPEDRLSTWGPEEDDCCQWYGVTCNDQGQVTELGLHNYLESSGLRGEISLSLFNITYLNQLSLYGNYFHGTIPMFIGSMTHLTILDLGVNQFTGTIPRFIGKMTQLTYLNLYSNNFTGTIPQSIGSLTKLTELQLGVNNFSGAIPSSIGSLTKLTYLNLDYNSFSGTIPPEFGNLTSLLKLSLVSIGSCTIDNLDWLSRLSYLYSVKLDENSLAKANNWVNVIIGLQNLSYLSLRGCNLSLVVHPYSSSVNSSSIATLFLDNNNLNSSTYRWLCPLVGNKLKFLQLSGNTFNGKVSDFLKHLSGCASTTLQGLDASNCQFTGLLSDVIQNFSSLTYLNLSSNRLDGTISDKLWELPLLYKLDLSSNSFRGYISEKIGKSSLAYIDLSNTSLEGFPFSANMSNLSQHVEYIDFSSCKLGPRFPKWIQNMKNLLYLDLSKNSISDTISIEYWNKWNPSQLHYLDLSFNRISGILPDLLSNLTLYSVDLSSNSFYGSIPAFPAGIAFLNLSRNKFSGGISFLCQVYERFEFLDLSRNRLTGQIPDCLWHFKELVVLNLANNNLSGRIPASVKFLIKLEALYLYNNNLFGELPSSLKHCTHLTFLNLGANKFSGNVPVWIGENLSHVYVLSLASNNFHGTIPLQLCHLVNLQLLDLSMNNLYGTIPSCVNNLTAMVLEIFSLKGKDLVRVNTLDIMQIRGNRYTSGHDYFDHVMIRWQGKVREFSRNLESVKSIDLSSNNLTGKIPYEVTNLYQLVALNLSNNALCGEIPSQIGQMKELETLDLSKNNFTGGLPLSMSQMHFLSYLDVSHNNLSGRIPSGPQFDTSESSRYIGNAGLCGLPLTKYCPGDKTLEITPVLGERKSDGEAIHELQRWFYIGGTAGFVTGFWIVCSALLLNRRGRRAFFHFHDSVKDRVYVKVRELLVSKLTTTLGDVFSLARTTECLIGGQQKIDVESNSDNEARDQSSELETKVLVDGKQDEAKVVKVVGVADEQNSNEQNVLEGTLQQKPLSLARFSPATYVAGEKSLNDKNTPTWHFFSLNL
ncbi:leucine-rich repeat-containing protein [Tanacetum coccineum]